MTKRPDPSQQYLKNLKEDLESAQLEFQYAKAELYKHTATAKLGEAVFELAREECIKAVKKIEAVEAEIERVQKAL